MNSQTTWQPSPFPSGSGWWKILVWPLVVIGLLVLVGNVMLSQDDGEAVEPPIPEFKDVDDLLEKTNQVDTALNRGGADTDDLSRVKAGIEHVLRTPEAYDLSSEEVEWLNGKLERLTLAEAEAKLLEAETSIALGDSQGSAVDSTALDGIEIDMQSHPDYSWGDTAERIAKIRQTFGD